MQHRSGYGAPDGAHENGLKEEQMAVKTRWLGEGYKSESYDEAGGHRLLGDEPEEIGGSNTAPSPFSLLQTSIGNCAMGAMLRAARDEKIPIEALEADVAIKMNRLDESATSHFTVTCDLRMTEIRMRLRVTGDIDEEQTSVLMWAAENCPVGNTIGGGVPITREIEVIAPS